MYGHFAPWAIRPIDVSPHSRFAPCPWGETSMGRIAHGARRPWGELSVGRKVYKPWLQRNVECLINFVAI